MSWLTKLSWLNKVSFKRGYTGSSCYCERSLPANKLTVGTSSLPSSLNDQSRAQRVERYPPWVSASRHQDLTIQTLNKGKGRSHSHWPQFQSSKPFPLWCYGVLALVHTANTSNLFTLVLVKTDHYGMYPVTMATS